MSKLSDMNADVPAKILVVGDPGTGKTGSLCSLVKAGYELFMLNFEGDAHIAPLRMFLTQEEQARVHIETLRDDMRLQGKFMVPRKAPNAFIRSMQMLDKWQEGETDYGSIYDWGPERVLVLDSVTSMGTTAMTYQLFVNGRYQAVQRGARSLRRRKDWGEAMEKQGDFLEMLRSINIRCNVVVIAHLTLLSGDSDNDEDEEELGDDGKPKPAPARHAVDFKRFPSALGKKLPPRVSGMFATAVQCRTTGTGRNMRRIIRTVPDSDVDLKLPALNVPSELPLDTGLATIFEALRVGASLKHALEPGRVATAQVAPDQD